MDIAKDSDGGSYFGPSCEMTDLEQCLFQQDEFRSAFQDHESTILREHYHSPRCMDTVQTKKSATAKNEKPLLMLGQKRKSDGNGMPGDEHEDAESSPQPHMNIRIPVGPQTTEPYTTREKYKMYKYLQQMPKCVRSMIKAREFAKDGLPLKDRIILTMHHIDGKTLGGFAVLRELGATTMYNVFIGYDPAVIPQYFDDINDIDPEEFQATILVPKALKGDVSLTAEATYSLPADQNLVRINPPLPTDAFNKIFQNGVANNQRPMVFLDANRSLAGFLFLRALAEAIKTKKKVLIFEDGGYMNPMIDTAIDPSNNLTIAEFREKHGIPGDLDAGTDQTIGYETLADAVKAAFVGTCELTRNGYNATQCLYEKRAVKAGGTGTGSGSGSGGYLNTRFTSIAVSYWKTQREGNNIALACLNGLASVLYSIGWTLSMRNVCVLGARGSLGRLFCKYLSGIATPIVDPSELHGITSESNKLPVKSNVWGVDTKVSWTKLGGEANENTPKWATPWDTPVEGTDGESARYKDIPKKHRLNFDIIFGWTGGPMRDIRRPTEIHETFDGDDLAEWLVEGKKPVLFLASGSSKTVEFKTLLTYITALVKKPKDQRVVKHDGRTVPVVIQAEPIPDSLSLDAAQSAGLNEKRITRDFGIQFAFTMRLPNDTSSKHDTVTKVVYLTNKTMPINFLFYGTATEVMDGSYAQVTSATAKFNVLCNEGKIKPGCYPIDYNKEVSKDVYDAWPLDKTYQPPPSSGTPIS